MDQRSLPCPDRLRGLHAFGGRRGTSLVELAVAASVIGTMTLAALSLQVTTANASREIRSGFETVQTGARALDTLRRDLNRGRIEGIAPDGSSITYSLPLVDPVTGSFLDAGGNIRWGISDENGPVLGGTCTVAFQVEAVASEAALNRDLNGDGDLDDVFDRGRLSKTASTGEPLPLSRLDLFLPTGDYSGDVDSDGTDDPLFSLAAARQVTLRIARPPADGIVRVHEFKANVVDSTF